jgi:hypothetical protein
MAGIPLDGRRAHAAKTLEKLDGYANKDRIYFSLPSPLLPNPRASKK